MSLGSFAPVGLDSKRQRAVPLPKANANMKTFTPDSSIASDVIPSANYGDRNKARLPDMIILHYTGMPDVEGAITRLCTAGTFPWHSLANSGVGHWVQPAPIVRGETLKLGTISDDVRNLQVALARYGYSIPDNGKYDAATMEVVTAFQRHFRPARVDGVADHSTMTTLHTLLASLSTDAQVVAAK
jgi:N-acetyl-anhydromuramyl-L-alanine amidase AmpD